MREKKRKREREDLFEQFNVGKKICTMYMYFKHILVTLNNNNFAVQTHTVIYSL